MADSSKSKKRKPTLQARAARYRKTAIWFLVSTIVAFILGLGAVVEAIQKLGNLFEKGSEDVSEIANLRQRMEAQAATIDLIAKRAAEVEAAADRQNAVIAAIGEQAADVGGRLELMAKDGTEAREKVNEVAKDAANVRTRIVSLTNTVDVATKDLAELQTGTEKAQAELERIREYMKLQPVLLAAQADSRSAFEQLKRWAEDPNCLFKTEAKDAWWTIVLSFDGGIELDPRDPPWSPLVNPSTLSFSKLVQDFRGVTVPALRMSLLKYIWGRTDFGKGDRMHLLAHVIKEDTSLKVVSYAARLFDTEAKLEKKRLLLELYLDWWERNKANYPESPPDPASPKNLLMPNLAPLTIGAPFQPPTTATSSMDLLQSPLLGEPLIPPLDLLPKLPPAMLGRDPILPGHTSGSGLLPPLLPPTNVPKGPLPSFTPFSLPNTPQ